MILDIVLIFLIIIAIFKGLRRGLIVAVFSLLSFFVGLAAAIKLSAFVADRLKDAIHISARWLPILAFILVFLLVVLLLRWAANLIQAAVDFAWLGGLNKLGGVLLYVLLYIIIYSVFLFYGAKSHILSNSTIQSSATYKWIEPLGPAVVNAIGKIFPFFKGMFESLEEFFSHLVK
ncbi:MAG: CvpA family protein [Chitinophagales bacterium]